MRLPKFLIPFGVALAFSASEAHAQFRNYDGCISIPYKGSPGAEFYKAFISKVPFKERKEVSRQPADMKTFEFYGLETGAIYKIEISACRQDKEGEICDPPDVVYAYAKVPK
jgi:hypothetical protein